MLYRYVSSLRLLVVRLLLYCNGLKSVVTKCFEPTALADKKLLKMIEKNKAIRLADC